MRLSSPGLAAAFGRGAAAQGADVISAGLGSTDMLYYASGSLDIPGAMITASHNPAQYNGIKLCRAGARPVGAETGLHGAAGHGRGRGARPTRGRRAPSPGGTCCPATPTTSRPWSTCPASGRSRWPWTRATGWAGTPCPGSSRACPSRRCRCTSSWTATSPTTRPTPSTRANLADLQQAVVKCRRRPRAGLRRRRRPLLRRRRARRDRLPVGAHRADRRPRAAAASRAPRSSTT